MKKINVTVVCAGEAENPGCAELLAACPELNLVAVATDLEDDGIQETLVRCDVLVMNEAILDAAGHRSIRKLHDDFPQLRSLMVVDGEYEYKTLAAVSLGVQGVIGQSSMVAMLRKAVVAIYSGEAWLSRGLVQPLRDRVNRGDDPGSWSGLSNDPGFRGKLN